MCFRTLLQPFLEIYLCASLLQIGGIIFTVILQGQINKQKRKKKANFVQKVVIIIFIYLLTQICLNV